MNRELIWQKIIELDLTKFREFLLLNEEFIQNNFENTIEKWNKLININEEQVEFTLDLAREDHYKWNKEIPILTYNSFFNSLYAFFESNIVDIGKYAYKKLSGYVHLKNELIENIDFELLKKIIKIDFNESRSEDLRDFINSIINQSIDNFSKQMILNIIKESIDYRLKNISYIEGAKNILKLSDINVFGGNEWKRINTEYRLIRNAIAHNNGKLDKNHKDYENTKNKVLRNNSFYFDAINERFGIQKIDYIFEFCDLIEKFLKSILKEIENKRDRN